MRKISYIENIAITGNAAILAIIHTAYGAFISYVLYYLFDEFDDAWKARSTLYQVTDVSVELLYNSGGTNNLF